MVSRTHREDGVLNGLERCRDLGRRDPRRNVGEVRVGLLELGAVVGGHHPRHQHDVACPLDGRMEQVVATVHRVEVWIGAVEEDVEADHPGTGAGECVDQFGEEGTGKWREIRPLRHRERVEEHEHHLCFAALVRDPTPGGSGLAPAQEGALRPLDPRERAVAFGDQRATHRYGDDQSE